MLDKSVATYHSEIRFLSVLQTYYSNDEVGFNQGMRSATITEGSA